MSDEAWIETQGPGLWVPPAPAPLTLPDLFSAMPACCWPSLLFRILPSRITQPPFQTVLVPRDDFNGDLKRWEMILVWEENCKAMPSASFHHIIVVLLFSLS